MKHLSMAEAVENEAEDTLQDQLEDLLNAGNKRFDYALEGWQRQRQDALSDLKFYHGEQASDVASPARREPQITVNQLPRFVSTVANAIAAQDIAINVYPTDELGSEDTAGIIAGMVRDIERKSYARSAYMNAVGENGVLVAGFGFLKLETKYINGTSNLQEIVIKSPRDPFKVLPDPDALEPDASDARFWFEFEDYSVADYNNLFPHSKQATFNKDPHGAKKRMGDTIRVMKYWYAEEVAYTKYLLEDGTEISTLDYLDPNEDEDEAKDRNDQRKQWPEDAAVVLRSRQIVEKQVKWAIMNGVEVLDAGDWPDSEFPFVAVYGPTTWVDGVRDIRGIVRYAKDSQRMLNYMASSTVRRIGSANKSPWVADARSIQGYEKYWKTANTENWSVLPYNSTDEKGNALPPPQRADQTGQINDLIAAAQKFENDLKATVGIYDAGLGATPNEQSGIAIKTLAQQGQDANQHFSVALERAICRLGTLLVRLIPKVYDTARAVRIIGADSQEKIVRINQLFEKDGEVVSYDLASGDYGVAVSAGPAYASKKSQALEQIIRLAQGNPAVLPFIQDIIIGQMDFDQAPLIQARLRKALAIANPQIIEDEETQALPPQAQAAMAQLSAMVKKLTEEVQVLQGENHKLQVEKMSKVIEHQGQLAVVQAKAQAEMQLAMVRAQAEAGQHQDKLQADMVKARLDHTQKLTETLVKNPHLMEQQHGNE